MSTIATQEPISHLCQLLGYDAPARKGRLELMGLDEQDAPILEQLSRQVIRPHADAILDGFYTYLLEFEEMRHYLGSAEHIQRLKLSQREYIESFGIAFQEEAYFEYRLRIGKAHERIGMPLNLYLAAYRELQALIIDHLSDSLRLENREQVRFVQSIGKIIMLDISLAIDAYSQIQNQFQSESLQVLTKERDLLNNQLMRDSLTGTLSRRFILEALTKQLAFLARNPNVPVSIALLDLDHFKQVNDDFGHLVGDKVLYEFSRVASNRVREQDYFGRFGGEEFLLILIGQSPADVQSVLERIRVATQLQIFTHGSKRIPLTVSIGCTKVRPGEKVDDVIERADLALYEAKHRGRNQVRTQ